MALDFSVSKKEKNSKKEKHYSIEDEWVYDQYFSAKKSVKTWQLVSLGLGVLSFLSILAVLLLTPLKTVEPFLIYGDTSTGHFNRIQRIADEPITMTEAENRYWVAKYVTLREKFFFETAKDDFDEVSYLSSEEIARQWDRYFHPSSNPKSPVLIYGKNFEISIKVKSITSLGTSSDELVYQVRFMRIAKDRKNGSETVNHFIANVVFRYNPKDDATESYRLLNPNGFQVTQYQISEDSF